MRVISDIAGDILQPCSLENFAHQVEPYVGCGHLCHYCYVLPQAVSDWTQEVHSHPDIAERLAAELEGLAPQTIYMGWHTDPYQPCEAEQQQTRQVLEVLLARRFSASVLTKSGLVLRDLDLLEQMPAASVSVSVAFSDDRMRPWFEHDTMATDRRMAALAELRAAGVGTGALVCPIIPYITDPLDLVKRLVPHTDRVWLYGLSVPDRTAVNWQNVRRILAKRFVDQAGEIEAAVFDRAHPYWTGLRKALEGLQAGQALNLSIHV